MSHSIVLIADNIRSVQNVGSLFRTANCFGVTELYLCGVTPAPIDRFGRIRSDMARVALGAETDITWKQFITTADAIHYARANGYAVCALEQNPGSQPLSYMQNLRADSKNIAVVVGTETTGLTQSDIALCDHIFEIEQFGSKESLNVSVAAGIALYELRRNIGIL